MGIFSSTPPKGNADPMATALRRYQTARTNIIFLVVLTLINLVMEISGSFTYFLFSASVPYVLVDLAMFLCGMYPREYYIGIMTEADFLGNGVFAVMLVIALCILLVYTFFYFRTKRVSVGFMTATLVFFVLDTLLMLWYYGIAIDMIIDFIFHGYIIVAQILAIRAASDLKKAEAEGKFDGTVALFPTQKAAVPNAAAVDATEELPLEDASEEASEKYTETEKTSEEASEKHTETEKTSEENNEDEIK